MEIKTTKLSIFDGLELKEATFRKQCFPSHFHDSYSIGIIEHGLERLAFNDKEILAHANTVVIINPYDIHANSYYDNDSWKYRTMYVSIDAMKHVQQQMGLNTANEIWFPKQTIDDVNLYMLLLNFHNAPAIQKQILLQQILYYLISRYAKKKPHADEAVKHAALQDAAYFIREHYNNKLPLDELASRFGMDKYKFIRLFKKQTGLTPVSYTLLERINKAKLLIAQNMPIVEVALETGFYDQSHFIHCFKKYIGVAPLRYKQGIITEH